MSLAPRMEITDVLEAVPVENPRVTLANDILLKEAVPVAKRVVMTVTDLSCGVYREIRMGVCNTCGT